MIVKACLNGPRRPGEHPALPVTAQQLAADVAAVTEAGAAAVHLHVKDAQGADTFGAAELAEVLAAVRAVPSAPPVGVTTGAWALPDVGARVAAINAWDVLPDFASVNWHEDGADDVAAALLHRGVGVEAGLWHADAVAAWTASPLRDQCLRVLIELPDGLSETETPTEADRLLRLVRSVAEPSVLLHGEGSSCWSALRYAGRLGLDTRIGLEDTLAMPDGSAAPDNAALVGAARNQLS